MPRYYNIDDILAEEELVPCVTLFDFSYLAHLDPELQGSSGDGTQQKHYLPENSRVKLALWAVEKWAMLGFVRLSLPRHFQRRARERLEAEPAEVDLRKRNERFFLSGNLLVNLVEQSSAKVAKAIASQPGRNPRRNAQIAALEAVLKEARELRTTLVAAYTGDRLRRTLDWSLSSAGDDVSSYTDRLTELERRLFGKGAAAAADHARWKMYGMSSRRRGRGVQRPPTGPSTVDGGAAEEEEAAKENIHPSGGMAQHRDKRHKTY